MNIQPTTIYFVRHSESDKSFTGHDSLRPLTPLGLERTKLVTNFLKDKQIETIFSSPYKRCLNTLEDFAISQNHSITVFEGLGERFIGTHIENFTNFAKKQWDDFNYKLDTPNSENLAETQERNIAVLQKILAKNQGKTIAIGTHGTAVSVILHHYIPTFHFDDFNIIRPKTPHIIKATFQNQKYISHKPFDLY